MQSDLLGFAHSQMPCSSKASVEIPVVLESHIPLLHQMLQSVLRYLQLHFYLPFGFDLLGSVLLPLSHPAFLKTGFVSCPFSFGLFCTEPLHISDILQPVHCIETVSVCLPDLENRSCKWLLLLELLEPPMHPYLSPNRLFHNQEPAR